MQDDHPRTLVFNTPQGGTGQSSIVAHVALGLARQGKFVVLIDQQSPSVAASFLAGTLDHASAPTPIALGSLAGTTRQVDQNLWIVSTPNPDEKTITALSELASRATPDDLWLVVDEPQPFASQTAMQWHADLEIQVLRAEPSSLLFVDALKKQPELKVVLNKIDPRARLSTDIDRVLSELLDSRLLARIHHDEAMPESLALGQNLLDAAPGSHAAGAIIELVSNLIETIAPATPIMASRGGE